MKFIIPILSLIISVIALAVALPRPNNLGIDYLGIIVAIISLATAFAVGFQIWNALSLEVRLKELRSNIEAVNKTQLEETEKKLQADSDKKVEHLSVMNAYSLSMLSSTIALSNDNYSLSFYNLIRALDSELILKKENINVGISVVEFIETFIDSDLSVCFTELDKQEYIIKTIMKSGSEELIEKIGMIKSKMFKSEHTQE